MTDKIDVRYLSPIEVEEITTSASFSTDTTHHELTCPADKVYEVHYFSVDNDVSSTIAANLLSPDGKKYQILLSEAATTAFKAWPQHSTLSTWCGPIVLTEGHQLAIVWGTAQSTSVEVCIAYRELLLY